MPDLTPPPELVQQWWNSTPMQIQADDPDPIQLIATQAARWAADQELEACCALMDDWGLDADDLRAARRPTPSLKEQALAKLTAMERLWEASGNDPSDTIRRALEQLPDAPAATPDPAPTAEAS